MLDQRAASVCPTRHPNDPLPRKALHLSRPLRHVCVSEAKASPLPTSPRKHEGLRPRRGEGYAVIHPARNFGHNISLQVIDGPRSATVFTFGFHLSAKLAQLVRPPGVGNPVLGEGKGVMPAARYQPHVHILQTFHQDRKRRRPQHPRHTKLATGVVTPGVQAPLALSVPSTFTLHNACRVPNAAAHLGNEEAVESVHHLWVWPALERAVSQCAKLAFAACEHFALLGAHGEVICPA
mmetsp:Transcript_4370/g.11320  ORF Transcript_4370/g.11320 Transcript_4370/m.11320 type:complete len:237 (-) Transcript_4370:1724-2434(-)